MILLKIWDWCRNYIPFMLELDHKIKEYNIKRIRRNYEKYNKN